MIQSHINKLTTVSAGDLITTAVTAKRLNAIQDAIKALARGDNIREGDGIKVRRSSSGAVLSRKKQHNQERWQRRVFQYIADGTDEAIDTIGQDPAFKTPTHCTGDLRHGGLHKLDGLAIPFANMNANGYGGYMPDHPSTTPHTLNVTKALHTASIQGNHCIQSAGSYLQFLSTGVYEIEMKSSSFLKMDDCETAKNYHNMTFMKWASLGGGGYDDYSMSRSTEQAQDPQGNGAGKGFPVKNGIIYETINTSKRIPNDFKANLITSFFGHGNVKHCIDGDVIIRPAYCSPHTMTGEMRTGDDCEDPNAIGHSFYKPAECTADLTYLLPITGTPGQIKGSVESGPQPPDPAYVEALAAGEIEADPCDPRNEDGSKIVPTCANPTGEETDPETGEIIYPPQDPRVIVITDPCYPYYGGCDASYEIILPPLPPPYPDLECPPLTAPGADGCCYPCPQDPTFGLGGIGEHDDYAPGKCGAYEAQAPGVWTSNGTAKFWLEVYQKDLIDPDLAGGMGELDSKHGNQHPPEYLEIRLLSYDPLTQPKLDQATPVKVAGYGSLSHQYGAPVQTAKHKDLKTLKQLDNGKKTCGVGRARRQNRRGIPDGAYDPPFHNSLSFHARTAHYEWESAEHPTNDPRWETTQGQIADFQVTVTRMGEPENIDNVVRPENLPEDLSAQRVKDVNYEPSPGEMADY